MLASDVHQPQLEFSKSVADGQLSRAVLSFILLLILIILAMSAIEVWTVYVTHQCLYWFALVLALEFWIMLILISGKMLQSLKRIAKWTSQVR
jgi:hypothetical protein